MLSDLMVKEIKDRYDGFALPFQLISFGLFSFDIPTICVVEEHCMHTGFTFKVLLDQADATTAHGSYGLTLWVCFLLMKGSW